jgi:CBS domain-containing protein
MNEDRRAGMSVRICHPDDSLRDAARMLLEGDCGCLLVRALDEGDRVAGLITDRDIWMAVYRYGKGLEDLRVQDAMSAPAAGFGLPEALAAARVEDHGQTRPLALLDDQGQMLAIVSLVRLGARVGASLAGEERIG